MNASKQEKLDELQRDDLIWYIYIFIVVAALYSNALEKEYVVSGDKEKAAEFHSINLVVLTIVFLIYTYFVLNIFRHYDYSRKKTVNLIGAILFLVAGGMFLWVEINNTNNDLNEIAL